MSPSDQGTSLSAEPPLLRNSVFVSGAPRSSLSSPARAKHNRGQIAEGQIPEQERKKLKIRALIWDRGGGSFESNTLLL